MAVTRILHAAGNYRATLSLASLPEVDAIEADVWMRSSVLFVNHARPIGRFPYVISTKGIRRQERDAVDVRSLLDAVEGVAQLVLDLRSWVFDPAPDLVRVLYPVADRSHLLVTCESWTIADRLRTSLPDLRVAYSLRSEGDIRRYVQGRISGRLQETAVTVKHSLLHSPEEVAVLNQWAGAVGVWTVDDLERARELVSWGAASVTSNRLEVLAALT